VTTRAATGFWTPTNEAGESLAGALRAHWAEATKVAATSPFFRRSANWLEASRHRLIGPRFIGEGWLRRPSPQPVRATSQAAPARAATIDVNGMKRPA
jgi:hypothetical protein